MITVSSGFDAGAIEVREIEAVDGTAARLVLAIRADSTLDPTCDFRQWFYFRVQGARRARLEIRLANAAQCTYPDGWSGYRACASYDREHWFRVPTTYVGGQLVIEHAPERDSVFYAYFEPYSWERHLALLARLEKSPLAQVRRLATTLDGRDLDLVTIGGTSGDGKAPVWIIARQHPGEAMAEWFVEGLCERLLDRADPISRVLLSRAVFFVVPNMNPDGSVRGNLRANGAGANLNREWMNPSAARSPEVLAVREAMHASDVRVFLDVHGDEALPYVFVAGSEMLPGFNDEQARKQRRFGDAFMTASPDFQMARGYPSGKYDVDALRLASKYVGHTFGCLSLTLEMPFKDNANLPDEEFGWDGARSKRLGAASLQAILAVLTG